MLDHDLAALHGVPVKRLNEQVKRNAEQGVAMLSSVLRSPRAVQVNIEIMRTFVRLRRVLETNQTLARKLDALEKKYDGQFRVVFDAIPPS